MPEPITSAFLTRKETIPCNHVCLVTPDEILQSYQSLELLLDMTCMQNELRLPSQTVFTAQPARDEVDVVAPNNLLVLLAPATPLALSLSLALSLAPLTSTLVGSASLGAGLGTGILSAASDRCSGGTLLSTASLGIASGRDAGSAVSTGRGLSTSRSLSTGRSISTRGSRGASLSGGTGLRSSARRSRARAVQLALDESEGVLAVHVAVALVSGLVAAVTAVRVGAVAVGLHLGAGLL